MLPHGAVYRDPFQVGPVFMVAVIIIHEHQQHVGPGQGKCRQVIALLRGGRVVLSHYKRGLTSVAPLSPGACILRPPLWAPSSIPRRRSVCVLPP